MKYYAHVLIEVPALKLDKTFLYECFSTTKIGMRVYVPFQNNNRQIEGIVLKVESLLEEDANLLAFGKREGIIKSIIKEIDDKPLYNDEMISLGLYMAKRYISGLNKSFKAMLPSGLKLGTATNYKPKMKKVYNLVKYQDNLRESQQQIVDYLKDKEDVFQEDFDQFSTSSLKTLLKNEIISVKEVLLKDIKTKGEDFLLNDEQLKIYNDIKESNSLKHLLYGVTGSGKTHIYIKLIEDTIKVGKSVILLLPEILLTMEIVGFFEKYFKSDIAVIHSGLTKNEKLEEHRKIYEGEVKVVLGARSAIFAPLKDLGLIIIDEAHSRTYIQDSDLPYSAIEVAYFRSGYNKCKVVLGTATPLICDYYDALNNNLDLHKLDNRYNLKNTTVKIVDMKEYPGSMFSNELIKSIEDVLSEGLQVILFYNRKGYERFAECLNCGTTVKCQNCDISMVYYKSDNTLRCHYCGYTKTFKKTCPECHEESLDTYGVGIEKVVEETKKIFNHAVVERLDGDVVSKKGVREKVLKDFKEKNIDILVGTQMISKGLDIEKVVLVGVINADTSLNMPTYLASENTFQELVQTIGRSGRGKYPGRVIIQTFNPDNYTIKTSAKQDYLAFYQEELNIRKELSYPPFKNLLQMTFYNKDERLLQEDVLFAKQYILNKVQIEVLGPNIHNSFKINNIYKQNILIKYDKINKELYLTLISLKKIFSEGKNTKIIYTFNPYMV